MARFDYDPASFSKITYNIGGISVHVYNSDALIPYIEAFNKSSVHVDEIPINVNYLLHGRTRTYKDSEAIAYNILRQVEEKREHKDAVPLICVAFDLRNHGERTIDASKNDDWLRGNQTHAVDMLSTIMGNVQDLKVLIDFLPDYLNLESYLTNEFKSKNQHYNIKHRNIISGYSLGAHTVFRFANEYPDLVYAINPVIGCVDLSSLLINRLKQNDVSSTDYDKRWFYYSYDELKLSPGQETAQYPEHFHKVLSKQDESVWENFAMNSIKMHASFGQEDKLVPHKLSSVWCDSYLNTNGDTEVNVYEGVGHDVPEKMVEDFTTWLVKYI
ncbi:hypothetical protein KGF57_000262 [Candida theae]|uniref:AB hydrolase-1 domain-containing protein n=1 Tax=Candida theae TaxID=1198502 RepID=A0AAD5G0Z4_9ASCO|nr:uncharacterized protein KGF57_000262 [Candida theae]KAI5968036.1 hypothetical protein KGF57_000262 [Candida theae]